MAIIQAVPQWRGWLKWTLLYGLLCYGVFYATHVRVAPQELLLPVVYGLAVLVGILFPSGWWILGAPLGVLVPLSGLLIADGWGDVLIMVVPIGGATLALAAAVGVVIGIVIQEWRCLRWERRETQSARD